MDIEHMGPKVVEHLVEAGFVGRVSDIYLLDEEMLSQLEGFKEKSIQNLLESIEKSKNCTLAKFIMGLEIPYIGAETAEILAFHSGDLDHFLKLSKEELLEIEQVGQIVADAILAYFANPIHVEEIRLLLAHGVQPQKASKHARTDHPFYKKTFVLTGTLEKFSREEATSLIKERGGKTSSSVSSKTDFVLAGENPGSKYEKAIELGVKILTEEEFTKLL